ncbi:MAG: hypothetical protein RLZZ488_2642 [Pseudomonadota bacterium]|jgi:magnesium-transporting ATPase (P-type)
MSMSISEISKLDISDVQRHCYSSAVGLTSAEAAHRLQKFGKNILPRRTPKPLYKIILDQFKSSIIYILLGAALFALAIGEFLDVVFILFVLFINAAIGTYHSFKSERTNFSLQNILKTNSKVIRDQNVLTLCAEDLVIGDVVILDSGATVPADIRILSAQNLFLDESLLTGESAPVQKYYDELTERSNILFAGTILTRGRAKGMVFQTGIDTAIGSIAGIAREIQAGKPPIIERVEKFSKVLTLYILVISIIIVLYGMLVQNQSAKEMIYFSITLVVSAIPEGLPIAMTLAFAVATRRMAKRGVIVKSLPSVEALGSCNVIATDKTGTLTCNEQTIERVTVPDSDEFEIGGRGYQPEGTISVGCQVIDPIHSSLNSIARAAVLCNEGFLGKHNDEWVWSGDPVDIALLTFGAKVGWTSTSIENLYVKMQEIPFESENRYSAAHFKTPEGNLIVAKGSPEQIFKMCDNSPQIFELKTTAEKYAKEGYRTVALAERTTLSSRKVGNLEDELSELKPLGIVGMKDPLRPGAKSTIMRCKNAGIRVLMLTGDHPETAKTIAYDLGLSSGVNGIVTGDNPQLQLNSTAAEIIRGNSIFARISPMQKLTIVQTLVAEGNFVAVTGDGVNDVPALQAANVGVALGKSGTDAAREAAGIVITDDDFSSIVNGIEEGRLAYSNIRKIILLLISTGLAEVILVILSQFSGLPLPLHPVQLLWLNLVTNGLQDVALAFEPPEEDLLKRKPRPPNEPILDRIMMRKIAISSLTIGLLSFLAFQQILSRTQDVTFSQSAVLLLMVFFENVHAASCRSERKSILKNSLKNNPLLIITILGSTLLHLIFANSMLGQKVLKVTPIPWEMIVLLFIFSLFLLVSTEGEKFFFRSRG